MKKITLAGAAVIAAAAYVITSGTAPEITTSTPAEGQAIASVAVPESLSSDAVMGKRAFDAVCAACHGENAAGKQGFGPPLVHRIYEPSHHGDMAFQLAVQQGVRAHHWQFGNMPPQDGLTRADVTAIVAYVRELQRANGIN
ncbi:c-type cytochrome [Allosediminivita pacifica]|uniref:Cytochrome c n=1 Tax=Allosediminivita pacifica TaxID=1267769 RepID=A0A2T6AC60_9RHOB|nr:cytochrome c [Allosediminivita pacifica]PTX41384.1 cytochrome c [Allosediminivita pacifica]GGB23440.1 hypothetical protein GCM10011324_36830 [Allosediminivita pacifica]